MKFEKIFGDEIFIKNVKTNTVIFSISHKHTAIISGILTQLLIISGAIGVFQYPIESLVQIGYAFFILLPVSYYQMRAYEKENSE